MDVQRIRISSDNRTLRTAAAELGEAIQKIDCTVDTGRFPEQGTAYLCIASENPDLMRTLVLNGCTDIHNAPAHLDSYEVFVWKRILFILGNSKRGVLNGIYALKEVLLEKKRLPDNLRLAGRFQIETRIFHQTFKGIPGERAHIRYISHLGASHCLLWHDWCNFKKMRNIARSDIFPKAVNPENVAENVRTIRAAIENCLDYGLEPAVWFTEIACQDGPWVADEERQKFLENYPVEVLSNSGTYQGKVLCFGHPEVKEYYRGMLRNLLADLPEIAVIFLFSLDSGGEYCHPDECPRCKGLPKIDQRDRFVKFMAEEAEKIKPGIRVLTTTWSFEYGSDEFEGNSIPELCRRQAALPPNAGIFAAAEVDGWQCERQRNGLLEGLREACVGKGQMYIGYDDFTLGDDTLLLQAGGSVRDIQDYPMGIGAKMKRWFELRADGIFDHWGARDEDISSNSAACREFMLNPLADREAVCRKIARRQFGPAGENVLKAWIELDSAQAILSNSCHFQPNQWSQWFDASALGSAEEIEMALNIRSNIEKPASGYIYNDHSGSEIQTRIAECAINAEPHLRKAVRYMNKALALTDDSPVFYLYFWNGTAHSPNRREHMERQKLYIESVQASNAAIGAYHAVLARYAGLSAKDQNAARSEYPRNCTKELDAAAKAFEEMVAFLERVKERFSSGSGLGVSIVKFMDLCSLIRSLK